MGEEIWYREAETADYGRICDIFNENIENGSTTLWGRKFTVAELAKLFARFSEREKVFVSTKSGKVMGWAMIKKYHEKEGYRTACETSLFLDRSYLNQGHGTAFKKFVIAQCKKLDYHHIHAKIMAQNEISIAYNLKLGYSIVGVQKEIGKIGDKWVDVVVMQLLI